MMVSATGPEAQAAIEAITELVDDKFNEEGDVSVRPRVSSLAAWFGRSARARLLTMSVQDSNSKSSS